MAVVYAKDLTMTTDEKTFMMSFLNTLTGISSDVTITGDISQYDDSSNRPQFIVNINGKQTFKFLRSAALSSNGYFNITGYKGGGEAVSSFNFNMWGTEGASSNANRGAIISYIVSSDNNFIFICIREKNGSSNWYDYIVSSSFKDSSNFYSEVYTMSKTATIAKSTLFNISVTPIGGSYPNYIYTNYDSPVNSGTFVSRFQYEAKPGKIDYVKSSSYVNEGVKVFDSIAICDCTTVTCGDTVSLKDGAYLAVGNHQLVKVS